MTSNDSLIERVDDFENYLKSLGYISFKQYSTHLRTAARILGQPISAKLIPNREAVDPLLSRLLDLKSQDQTVYESATKSAFYNYADLVALNFVIPDTTSQKETLLVPEAVLAAIDLDTNELAERVRTEVSRLVRDSRIVRQVKALHQNTCQICGDRLELRPGQYYSEAHHLKPFGDPHKGEDVLPNLICVCPTCHVRLDYATIRLDSSDLRTVAGHTIDTEFIDYHNGLCH